MVLDNAKTMVDKHSGYTVYAWNGKAMYGARVSSGVGVFTIMEVKSGKGSDKGWGRLEFGSG